MDFSSLPRKINEISPKWARFCLNVEKYGNAYCKSNFTKGSNIAAVSGGADSTALLIICAILTKKSGGKLFCANLDHGLRPESAEESNFVADICKALDIPFYHEKTDAAAFAAQNGLGIEDAGRKLRYNFFARLKNKLGADYLLTAHHKGDLCEDIIMRISRGTGWPALGGMPAYDPRRKLLRPLMSCSKQNLMDFLKAHNCNWCEDESNKSNDWTRNRFRNNILPLLKNENPNLDESLSRLHEQAALDADFFESELKRIESEIIKDENNLIVPKCTINKLHPALRYRLFKRILDKLGPGQALFESIRILDSAITNKKTGKIFQFPGDKSAELKRNAIVFKPGPSDH